MGRIAFIFKKRSNKLKSIIFSVIVFITILSIAISYQLHLTGITKEINAYAEEITSSIASHNLNNAEKSLSALVKLWENNSALLMAFHDHTIINNASTYVKLVEKSLNTQKYDEASSYLIHFTSLINELAAENRPTFENIF